MTARRSDTERCSSCGVISRHFEVNLFFLIGSRGNDHVDVSSCGVEALFVKLERDRSDTRVL